MWLNHVISIFLLVRQVTCQIDIINVEIDPITKTFQFSPLNRNSTADKVIGTVVAISGASARFQYALTDVIQDGKTNSGSWIRKARDFNNDDCSDETLTQYPAPRNYFCIDHSAGHIRTTKYFVQAKPESGVFFKFPILYQNGIQTYSEVSPHSVRVFSNCDQLTTLYNTLETSCNNDAITMGIGSEELASQKIIEFNIPNMPAAFLTLVKVKILKEDSVVKYGDVFIFRITLGNLQSTAKFVVLPSQQFQVAYVEPPLRLTKGDKYTILLMHTSKNNETNQINFNPSLTKVVVLDSSKDYCSNSPTQCQQSASKYEQVLSTITQECINIDEKNFYPKFGYCQNNPPPEFRNSTVDFDWDAIQQTQKPVDVLSNYVSNIRGKDTHFTIINIVSSNIITPKQVSTPNAHESCSNKTLQSLSMPRSFFCINSNDGGLYTTSALDGNSSPIDDFTVTIKLNVLSFPPMFAEKNILLRAKSQCRETTALFSKLSTAKCPSSSVFLDIQNKLPLEKQLKSSYSIDVKQSNDFDQASVYYLAGLKWKTSVQRLPSNDIGSYITFKLEGGRKTISANFFYIDDYMSFTEPLEYQSSATYKLSATRFTKGSTTTDIFDFDLTELQLALVIQEDYCSPRADCADLYETYQEAYMKQKTVIDTRCADPNHQGYKIMYGYCKDNTAPKVLKTSYLLNINSEFVKAEVIPGLGQRYVTDDNPLVYKILQITDSEPNGNTNNVANILTPNECTQKFTTYPNNYFCINENTGKIYTTSAIEGNVKVTSKFTIIVRVSDVSVFPIRILNVTLTLDANDKCSPASLTYNELSKCVDYAFLQPQSTVEKASLIYNVPDIFQVVIAVRFRLDSMKINNAASSKLSIGYDVKASNGSILFQNLTSEVSISSYLEEYSTAEITVINKNDIQSINITFYETLSDGRKEIVETNSNSAFLLYIQNFQCNKTCVNQFDAWGNQAATKDPSCRQDPSFYTRNFAVCKEMVPEFIGNLKLSVNSLSTGTNVSISNCSYQSPYEFFDVEWLKDGEVIKTIQKSTSLSRKRRSIQDYPNLPKYTEEALFLQNVKLKNQGSYSCRVKDGNKVASSKSIELKFKDAAKTTVEFVIANSIWDAAYNDVNSAAYKNKQKEIQDKVRAKLLTDGDPDNLILTVELSR